MGYDFDKYPIIGGYAPKENATFSLVPTKNTLSASGDPVLQLYGTGYFDAAYKIAKYGLKTLSTNKDMVSLTALKKKKNNKPDMMVADKGTHFEVLDPVSLTEYSQDQKKKLNMKYNSEWKETKRINWILNHFHNKKLIENAQPNFSNEELKFAIGLIKGNEKITALDKYNNKKELNVLFDTLQDDSKIAIPPRLEKEKTYKPNSERFAKALGTEVRKMFKSDGKKKPGVGTINSFIKSALGKLGNVEDSSFPIVRQKIARNMYNELIENNNFMKDTSNNEVNTQQNMKSLMNNVFKDGGYSDFEEGFLDALKHEGVSYALRNLVSGELKKVLTKEIMDTSTLTSEALSKGIFKSDGNVQFKPIIDALLESVKTGYDDSESFQSKYWKDLKKQLTTSPKPMDVDDDVEETKEEEKKTSATEEPVLEENVNSDNTVTDNQALDRVIPGEQHNRTIDALALGPTKYGGLQGSDALNESTAEITKQNELWKSFQDIRPGFGLVSKGGSNVLFQDNLHREKQIVNKQPLLNVGSADALPGNNIPIINQPFREQALTKDQILIDLLAERLVDQNRFIAESIRGGSIGNGQFNDVANNDRTGFNRKRPIGDVFVPVLQNPMDCKKLKPTFLDAFDKAGFEGGNTKMTSVFDRVPDFYKKYTGR